jgi:hypothetical protein
MIQPWLRQAQTHLQSLLEENELKGSRLVWKEIIRVVNLNSKIFYFHWKNS